MGRTCQVPTPFYTRSGRRGCTYAKTGYAQIQYTRARWYQPRIGRWTSPDPIIPDFRNPQSINRYAYVLANPVNRVDPSGLYHSDVHFDLTRRLAFATASCYFPVDVAWKLANCIAEGDQYVDQSRTLMALPEFGCMECHFYPFMPTIAHVKRAIESGDPFLFGSTLHQFQDFYSHWNEGYDAISGHGGDSYRAGVNPFGKPRSPGGKSARSGYVLDDFFEGGHYQPGWEGWLQSPYPAHPREEVIAEIRRRNLAIDLNGLNSNDLIDLYLRREPHQDPDWEQRVQERSHFGIDPDAYIASSTRDTYMRQSSSLQIYRFIQRIAGNVCAIDWGQCETADDSAIKALLTE
jgi:RHS repeat-associated protein